MVTKQRQRVTLITGASRGIGRSCAERLAVEGHAIIGLARRPPEGDFPGTFHAVDLADRDALDRVLAEVAAPGTVNGLINNVGLVHHHPIEDFPLADFDADITVNLRATMQCVKALAGAMKLSGFGRVLNISSELALGHAGRTGYSAAKAGVIALARTWSLELAPHGVTVNCIAPGPVDTEMFLANNPVGSAQRNTKLAKIPVGRIGRPEDIAAAAAFLMHDDSEWITGQTLFVCGGSSLGGQPIIA